MWKIFKNYESSKLLAWEILRTIHPVHTMALLYILENVIKDSKLSPVELINNESNGGGTKKRSNSQHDATDTTDTATVRKRQKFFLNLHKQNYVIDSQSSDNSIVFCDLQPTLNLQACSRDKNKLHSKNTNDDLRTLEMFNADGALTIYGFVKMMTNSVCNFVHEFSLCEREVMHNLRTKEFIKFSKNLLNHLMPDNLHSDRLFVNPTEISYTIPDLILKFFRFFNSLTNVTAAASRDAQSFNTVNRPYLKDIYERPSNMYREYYIQPR